MSASMLVITIRNHTVNFLKNVGTLCDVFSILERELGEDGGNINDAL